MVLLFCDSAWTSWFVGTTPTHPTTPPQNNKTNVPNWLWGVLTIRKCAGRSCAAFWTSGSRNLVTENHQILDFVIYDILECHFMTTYIQIGLRNPAKAMGFLSVCLLRTWVWEDDTQQKVVLVIEAHLYVCHLVVEFATLVMPFLCCFV
jgi:hypothetical protein